MDQGEIKPVSIVLIEDDFFQYSDIKSRLVAEFGESVRVITDELEFLDALPALAQSPPDVFLIDVMLPWVNPDRLTEGMSIKEIPSDRREVQDAGVRLQRDIRTNPSFRNAITMLFSVLDRADLPSTPFVSKGQDLTPLFRDIRRALAQRRGHRE